MKTVWFVTGTDTGVGKTVATAALSVLLASRGGSPYVVKPAQTGVSAQEPGDLDEVRRLAGPVPGHEGIRLREALAPETAARLEGADLPALADQRDAIGEAARDHEVVVEGAGGVLVRLGEDWDLLDLAHGVEDIGYQARVLVVARAGLGTLNHAALTVRAIQGSGLTVTGLVIGSWPDRPALVEAENLIDLPRITGVPLLGTIAAGAGALTPERFAETVSSTLTLLD